ATPAPTRTSGGPGSLPAGLRDTAPAIQKPAATLTSRTTTLPRSCVVPRPLTRSSNVGTRTSPASTHIQTIQVTVISRWILMPDHATDRQAAPASSPGWIFSRLVHPAVEASAARPYGREWPHGPTAPVAARGLRPGHRQRSERQPAPAAGEPGGPHGPDPPGPPLRRPRLGRGL